MRVLLLLFTLAAMQCGAADAKKIVFVAGKPSHGPGQHEHRAGCLLLAACLDKRPVTPKPVYHSPKGLELFGNRIKNYGVATVVYTNGWPDDPRAFDGADAIVLYMDGGRNHPALQGERLQQLDALMKRGVGLALLHYAVEPTKEKGQPEFLDWIGGCFEVDWSVNPHWEADFEKIPKHPITQGVKPFTINDEWYFHMRFRDGMKDVTPILTAVPPASTMSRPDGAHSGNPAVREAVRRGEPQHVAWARERADGGRGFGFTGAHFHRNWGDENFRKLVLNALLWVAKADVPKNGVECRVSSEDLQMNLDPKRQ